MYPELSRYAYVKVHIDVCMLICIYRSCLQRSSLSQWPGGISLCLCSAHSPGIGQFGLVASPSFRIPLQFQTGGIPTKEARLVDGKCMLDLKSPK